MRKRKKPVVLIVDEAHDLHHNTLTGLKRLIEMVADGGGKLSVLLAGWPRLRNDLRQPTMEEIGYRTTVFSLEGVTGSQREYIEWVLGTCAGDHAKVPPQPRCNQRGHEVPMIAIPRADDCDPLQLRAVTEQVLALARELRKGTIERVLGMSDVELGLQALLGTRPPGRR